MSLEDFTSTGSGVHRKVRCGYCGQTVRRSILPHMRKTHGEKWREWCLDFVRLYNQGYTSKRIMRRYNTLFTWTVIEKEIKKVAEEQKITLVAPEIRTIEHWQPEEFKKESTTVWRFPKRGNWCVHRGDYRGNWAPQVPRNIILQYTCEYDTILDPFVGGGTTIFECWLLDRYGIGIDISPHAISASKQRLREMQIGAKKLERTLQPELSPTIMRGDAKSLPFLSDESVDLICCQPPYADAIAYTWQIKGDLSRIHETKEFCSAMQHVAAELFRVLKNEKHCVVMMGDVRRSKMIVPLGFQIMQCFLDSGFDIEEIIIKKQYKDRSTQFYAKGREKPNFLRYRIDHEYLFVFRKLRKSLPKERV